MNITASPNKPLSPHVQRFVQELSQLETLVQQGKATAIEHVVYLTASHAVRYAGDDLELWRMLQKCQEHVVAFAANSQFPPEYCETYCYAGQRYQKLMDTLPPYPPLEEQAAGKTENTGEPSEFLEETKRGSSNE